MCNDNKQKDQNVDLTMLKGQLYDTMSKEANGFYNQMVTICTAFIGGTLVFFDKLFIGNVKWSLFLLFLGLFFLVYPLAIIVLVRWNNVEAHRHVLEYFKTNDVSELQKAISISKKWRKWTTSAIYLMVSGLFLIALFTAINIYKRYVGR